VTAEHEERVEKDLVAAVAENELIRLDVVALRQKPAQIDRRCGIPVEQDGVELLGAEPVAGRIGLRPLVRVEPDVGFDLLPGAVGRELGQIVSRLRERWGHAHRVR